MLFTPTRPFRAFQNKVWVSSNCAQCPAAPRKPGSCLHLCQRHPPTAATDSCNSTWTRGLFRRSVFFFLTKERSFLVLEDQSVKKEFFWTGLLRWWWRCYVSDVFRVMWGVQQEGGFSRCFPLLLPVSVACSRVWVVSEVLGLCLFSDSN